MFKFFQKMYQVSAFKRAQQDKMIKILSEELDKANTRIKYLTRTNELLTKSEKLALDNYLENEKQLKKILHILNTHEG